MDDKAWYRFQDMLHEAVQNNYKELYKNATKEEVERLRKEAYDLALPMFVDTNKKFGPEQVKITDFMDAVPGLREMSVAGHMIGIQELYMQFCYWRAGEKIYDIHQNLVNRFKITTLKSVPIELLRLPFQTIQLLVPDRELTFTMDEGNEPSRQIFIREITTTISPSTRYDSGNEMMIFVRNSDDVGYFRIQLTEDEVLKSLEASMKDMKMEDRFIREDKVGGFTDERAEELIKLFEFTLKSVLYITGANSDVEWSDPRQQIQAELKRAKKPGKIKELGRKLAKVRALYKVGHKIIISREEKMVHENIAKGLWKVGHRFIVQGHWRHQAYGPHHSERKLIFIEPHWKGPSFSEIINNPHLVK